MFTMLHPLHSISHGSVLHDVQYWCHMIYVFFVLFQLESKAAFFYPCLFIYFSTQHLKRHLYQTACQYLYMSHTFKASKIGREKSGVLMLVTVRNVFF